MLAEALYNRLQGERCIMLIRYSLGACVICSSLMSLAERHCFGLAENYVLLDAQCHSDTRV